MCGFFLRIFETLFVGAFLVADKLEEVRNVVGAALVADALDPGMLPVVDVLGVVGSVVKQNLDAIGASFFQAAGRPVIEQIGQAAGAGLVVSGLFVGEQQAGILGAPLRSGQSPLGVEQDGSGVRGENFADQRFEFFHHGVGDFGAFFFGQGFLQRAALVHGSGRDDTAFVGDFFEAGEFARGKLHGNPPELQIEDECVELTIVNQGGRKTASDREFETVWIPGSGSGALIQKMRRNHSKWRSNRRLRRNASGTVAAVGREI